MIDQRARIVCRLEEIWNPLNTYWTNTICRAEWHNASVCLSVCFLCFLCVLPVISAIRSRSIVKISMYTTMYGSRPDGLLNLYFHIFVQFLVIIGNRLFYFWKKHIWTYRSEIKVPSVFILSLCIYVCMYVCMYALSLQPTPFELSSWNLNHGVIMWFFENAFFSFLKFSFFWEICPFLWFSEFHAYTTITMTSHDDWYIKLKPWTSRKRCMCLNCIDSNMT